MAAFEAKLTSKGQITLPAKIRERLRVDTGDKVVFTESADGSYRLHACNPSVRDLRGLVRSGEKASGRDIARWIEEARGKAAPKTAASGQRNRSRDS
jgi:AbrB family looped-hinge helix DNA binding protein